MPTSVVSPKFADHLDRWGPSSAVDRSGQSRAACKTIEQAEAYCRSLTLGHYENFPVLSVAVPARLKQPICNVYAFCRWADDLGDEVSDPQVSLELLNWWRAELQDCFAGTATHPVYVALAKSIEQHDLVMQPFDDLISAFEQDQTVDSYDTFEQLADYCRRSADPVGRIVLRLFQQDSPANVQLSDEVCTGLQLINFWQDVARDADIGRTYLPREDRERFGYTAAMLASRSTNSEFRELMQFEVHRAEQFLKSGGPLARGVGGRLGVMIRMFAGGGLTIARKLSACDYAVWDRRPTLSKWDATTLFLSSLLGRGTM